jgi:hypothetical protein
VSCLDDVNVAITPKPGMSAGTPAARRSGPAKTGGMKSGGSGGGKAAAKSRGIRSVTEVLLKGQCENCG